MSVRRVVSDYAREPLHVGDLVCYATRVGNRVRMSDAVVRHVTAAQVDGRLRPMLLVAPTGDESGFVPRISHRAEWVSTEHVRLIVAGAHVAAQSAS